MTIEPAWLLRARQELGVHETPGPVSSPKVEAYRAMAGLAGIHGDDSDVPWCAIFVGGMLRQVGIKPSFSAMARSYSHWGNDCPVGTPGAVTVISSSRGPTSGHVFFATGRMTATHVEGCGGNQSDAVTLAWWPIARIVGSRWPAELQPPVGKPVVIGAAAPAKEVSDA
jgi:uncharacterized protein (TIGR02594 family)